MAFVNRTLELRALDEWWERPAASLGLVWGRRRVGKTALINRFARGRRTVFHTATARPPAEELRVLSAVARPLLPAGTRDLVSRPFANWDDAFETLAAAAASEPLLLVLDEFPELVNAVPELPSVIRALWDRLRAGTRLKVLFAGSAVRSMEAIQVQRSPMYGRLDLSLLLHPLTPHDAALMLPALTPTERAAVWGLVGGVPLYLEWWDQRRSIDQNLADLVCTPGGRLLTEGDFVLATEGDLGDLGKRVLYAIASGRTKHSEIADAVRADPTRTLDRLVVLRLVERVVPVTENPRRTRRRLYRLADNFLALWLGVIDRYRSEIDRGLRRSLLPSMRRDIEDRMGPPWEEAFRSHLRRLSDAGELGPEVVAVGRYWTASQEPLELDAVVLAGRAREAVLVGEARWARRVDGAQLRRTLEARVPSLPRARRDVRYAACARETVLRPEGLLAVTAADIF